MNGGEHSVRVEWKIPALPSYCIDIFFLAKETLFNQGKDGKTNSHEEGTGLVWVEGENIVPFNLNLITGWQWWLLSPSRFISGIYDVCL